MENEVKKCKFCGNEDESKLFVAISTDGKHEDGYECFKCSQERKCPKCGSRNIKREKGPNDFMPRKEEGEKARKQIISDKLKYRCLKFGCEHKWEKENNQNLARN